MPISVHCPSCSAPVTAPDSAAGKRVKCPKCQEVMQLPDTALVDFDVVEEPTPKKKSRAVMEDDGDDRPRKKAKSRRDEDDEDERPAKKSSRRIVVSEDEDQDDRPRKKSRQRDEDDEDERPRKKGKGSQKVGPPMGLLFGGGLALLLLIAGGLYFALKGGGGSGATTGAGTAGGGVKGTNWVSFGAPDGSFESVFPDGAPSATGWEELAKQFEPDFPVGQIGQNKKLSDELAKKVSGWSRVHNNRKYSIITIAVPAIVAGNVNAGTLLNKGRGPEDTIFSETDFDSGGIKGKQAHELDRKRSKWFFARVGTTNNGSIVVLAIESEKELKADDADVKVFFEKFQWKK